MKKQYHLVLLLCFSFFIRNNSVIAQPTLFGMTKNGGAGLGVIFGLPTGSTNYSHQQNFHNDFPGAAPFYTHLTEAPNGKLYGMTRYGGINAGLIFKYDPATNTYTDVVTFAGSSNGAIPFGSLTLATNGKLYGMTQHGGVNNLGVLFEYDPNTNIFVKKIDFNSTSNGAYPEGDLVQASNGKLYGMTNEGGNYGSGIFFEFNPSNGAFIKKFDFDGPKGIYPSGSLIQANNGKLYGMAAAGGANGKGVMFEYDITTSSYVKKLDFNGAGNGQNPYGSLIQANNGKLYGMTAAGGVNGKGVMFEYDITTSTYVKKLDFDGTGNGQIPYGSLIQATNGKLYGMTEFGGVNNYGVIFEYDLTTSNYTKKFDFDGAVNGEYPCGSLMQASNGKLYGMALQGGVNNLGVMFEYNTLTDVYAKKLDFNGTKEGNGSYPYGSLVLVNNNIMYGTTHDGGINGLGILFEYNAVSNSYSRKLSFNSTNGSNPCGSLIRAYNGKLYGMTSAGGTNNLGVLYEYDVSTGGYTKKLDFNGTNNGSAPNGSLLQAVNGKFYGMTSTGGVNNLGVLFEYDEVLNSYLVKFHFDGTLNGSNPFGSLFQASNGKLYGMTKNGGSNNLGVLFEYDIVSNTFTKKLDFNGSVNGSNPSGSLIKALNGKLYGMTQTGGVNNLGVLFEYDFLSNSYTKKLDFVGATNGSNPYGSLVLASNGKLYGITEQGGANTFGVIFEYDASTNGYVKKLDFNTSIGSQPRGNLIEVNTPFTIITLQTNVSCNGGSNGSAMVTALGGLPPYVYNWTPSGGNSYSETGLNAGIYSCSITDANSTTLMHTFNINQPSAIIATPSYTNITCLGDGFAQMNVVGGTGPYTYSWEPNGDNSQTTTSLTTAGIYTCYVSDIRGCATTSTVSIVSNTTAPSLSVTTTNDLLCVGQSATLSVTGASTYTWSTSENTNEIVVTPTIQSTYTVYGMDGNGCSDTTTIAQDVGVCTGLLVWNKSEALVVDIYPNPTEALLNIESDLPMTVIITTVVGKEILNEKFESGKNNINVERLASGVYFVKVIIGNKQQIVKICKT